MPALSSVRALVLEEALVSEKDVITIWLGQEAMDLVSGTAKRAEIGGRSRIREDADRFANLRVDQMVGQLGQLALHRYWYGHDWEYRRGRALQDKYPGIGDGGCDLPLANVDVKASLLRSGRELLEHHLLVRPAERHEGWVYVLALVTISAQESGKVDLVGWASEAMLPTEPVRMGILEGAFALPAQKLNPLPPVIWLA